jgi:protein involved in polysaccharide export with SLBB domain
MNQSIFSKNAILIILSVFLAVTLGICKPAVCQDRAGGDSTRASVDAPGDRISLNSFQASTLVSKPLPKNSYMLGPGDSLSVHVQSRSGVDYLANPENATKENPTIVTVSPSGSISLPLLGNLNVLGKSVEQVENEIRDGLAKYIKYFTIDVSLTAPRTLFVWIGGETNIIGPLAVSRTETASSVVLKSGIHDNGSARRVEIVRDGKKLTLDPYRVMIFGDSSADVELESGDRIYVPAVTRWVEASGEVVRGGRYEMATLSGSDGKFRVRDLLQLAVGPTPMAALDKSRIDRVGADGNKVSIRLDLSGKKPADLDIMMYPGDALVLPSISAFQPIIRMIGEFKGDGVYQRVVSGTSKDASSSPGVEVQNKSGIYYLKQGETAGDVITQTGGITPQADLKRAHIVRKESGGTTKIPLDLERLLVKNDKSADVALQSGDVLVLPANEDKVHVFGEVKSPGSYAYSPSRRLIDYLGDAGGPTEKSKLSQVRIVRGTSDAPQITVMDLKEAITGKSGGSNPILEAGDLVYIPTKGISNWQDMSQIIISTYSLTTLLGLR